ncbi:MAG: TetR/AcrR family transcriptional regulator [Lacrimispora sphenoides]
MKENTKGEKTKERIIECAAHLFLQKGYSATGINEILSAAGLSKGSFYFYFTSKKKLAIAVSEYFNRFKLNELTKAAKNKTWAEFIEAIVSDIMKRKPAYGCPFAVLGMETALEVPDIALKSYESIKQAMEIFEKVLIYSGLPEEKAAVNAERIFAMYEGYLLLYRVSQDVNQLEKLKRDLLEFYDFIN